MPSYNHRRFEFTREKLEQLRSIKKANPKITKVEACPQIGASIGIVNRSAREEGLYPELAELFPACKRNTKVPKRECKGLDMTKLSVRAATMKWRKAE